jgi:hypothetical protein
MRMMSCLSCCAAAAGLVASGAACAAARTRTVVASRGLLACNTQVKILWLSILHLTTADAGLVHVLQAKQRLFKVLQRCMLVTRRDVRTCPASIHYALMSEKLLPCCWCLAGCDASAWTWRVSVNC